MNYDIIVIGAGASGLISAITAKDSGKNVAIVESNNRVGKKILTTGNGRCNITNKHIELSRYHSKNNNFFNFALENFSCKDTELFFNSLGLPLVTLEDGKMYPMSLQASSVLDIMRLAIDERAIPVYLDNKVKKIDCCKNIFKIYTNNDELLQCEKLIIACGGKSAPASGSDGSIYSILSSLGHKLLKTFPSLVQLKLDYDKLKSISGIKFDGNASISVNDDIKQSEYGEILFTNYGISGPPILQLSRIASTNVESGSHVKIILDMMPKYDSDKVKAFIENHLGTFSYRTVFDSFIGILNKKLIPTFLKEAGIENIHKPCYELSWKERNNILKLLKHWEFTVTGTNSFSNAQVTAGGIDTKYVDSSTMESTIIDNLYFCGEILDVDGDCGGFNLQWAWSSGHLAGKSAALN
ncbi:MAG: NAD(P)/FAD-dependent oxidoreductase [Clostridium sp.]|nr:NAD(P)/FAD-dependent oxidoreductase [Clostridium sp.]